jgi:hypothetical protein
MNRTKNLQIKVQNNVPRIEKDIPIFLLLSLTLSTVDNIPITDRFHVFFLESTGDCVIAINTRHVAIRNDAWRAEAFHVAREYAKTKYDIPLFKLHELDPTKVRFISIDLLLNEISFYSDSSFMCYELYAKRLHSTV